MMIIEVLDGICQVCFAHAEEHIYADMACSGMDVPDLFT
jgi:hypothetical protein